MLMSTTVVHEPTVTRPLPTPDRTPADGTVLGQQDRPLAAPPDVPQSSGSPHRRYLRLSQVSRLHRYGPAKAVDCSALQTDIGAMPRRTLAGRNEQVVRT